MYKLGKLPAKKDPRNIRFSSILKKELLPPLPEEYDVDESLGGIDDNRVFGNDKYGNCVIASRAHQTLRFEKFEQGIQIDITDQEVIDEYFKESGGRDRGLFLLDSLKRWRKKGWKIGDKIYTIYAFAEVNWKNHDEVKYCIYLLNGINFGIFVFQSDMEKFISGDIWDIKGNPGQFLGGHALYGYSYGKVTGYNKDGLTCMTWGKRQFMTWNFFDARVDEAYGIVDNRDYWLKDSPIDVVKLDGYLKEITGGDDEKPPCRFSLLITKALNTILKKK